MSLKAKATQLQNMVFQGQILDAFEQFYHEDVTMQEPGKEPRVGKAANRQYEEQFVGMVADVHGGGVTALSTDEDNNVAMIESWMDVTFKDGNRVKMEQVSVQHWDGDQVVRERFYYKG